MQMLIYFSFCLFAALGLFFEQFNQLADTAIPLMVGV